MAVQTALRDARLLAGLGDARDADRRRLVNLAAFGTVSAALVSIGGTPQPEIDSGFPVEWPLHVIPGFGFFTGPVASVSAILGTIGLLTCWYLLMTDVRMGEVGQRTVAKMAALWSLPVLVRPPLLSSDVYSYAAQGATAAAGHDVYGRLGVAVLDPSPYLEAVDFRWQLTPSPYGPLMTMLSRAAVTVSGGHPEWTVLILRTLFASAAIAAVVLVTRLARPNERAMVLVLTAANPLFVVHVVGGGHMDGLVVLLMVAALMLYRRHPVGSVVVGAAAAMLKFPAAIMIIALSGHAALRVVGRERWRILGRDLAVAAAVCGVSVALVPDGLGWLRALGVPGMSMTVTAPTEWVRIVVVGWGHLTGAAVDGVVVGTIVRSTAAALAVVGVLLLLVTADRRPVIRTVALASVAVMLLGPVIFPWYVTVPLLLLAPWAGPRLAPFALLAAVELSVANLPTVNGTTQGIYLAVGGAVALLAAVRAWQTEREPFLPPSTRTVHLRSLV